MKSDVAVGPAAGPLRRVVIRVAARAVHAVVRNGLALRIGLRGCPVAPGGLLSSGACLDRTAVLVASKRAFRAYCLGSRPILIIVQGAWNSIDSIGTEVPIGAVLATIIRCEIQSRCANACPVIAAMHFWGNADHGVGLTARACHVGSYWDLLCTGATVTHTYGIHMESKGMNLLKIGAIVMVEADGCITRVTSADCVHTGDLVLNAQIVQRFSARTWQRGINNPYVPDLAQRCSDVRDVP